MNKKHKILICSLIIGLSTYFGFILKANNLLSDQPVNFKTDSLVTNEIPNDSSGVGKIAINICVDYNGNVITATHNDKKSTIHDPELIKLSIDGALKTKFSKKPIGTKIQCGTITYNFKRN